MLLLLYLKDLPSPNLQKFSPVFYSCIFSSLIHFELVFENSIRARLHSSACAYPVSPALFVEKALLSSTRWCWHFCQKSFDLYMKPYFWMFCCITLIQMSVFMPVPPCLDYHSFVISFEIRKYETLTLTFFMIVLPIKDPL